MEETNDIKSPESSPSGRTACWTSVRCFRRLQDEPCNKRRGIWLMTEESGRRGVFFHGDREEVQGPRYTVEELASGSVGFEVQEITPEATLIELSSWPAAQRDAVSIFEKHRV